MINLRPIRDFIISELLCSIDCEDLGYVNSKSKKVLTFLNNLDFLNSAENNHNISCILWDNDLGVPPNAIGPKIIVVKNSKLAFWKLQNSISRNYSKNRISESAKIHKSAEIASSGVIIEDSVIVESHTYVGPGSHLKSGSIVRSGARIATQALALTDDRFGNRITLTHLGGVMIGKNVEVGDNSVIDRAIFQTENTEIGDNSKIGCLTNISHGVKIGVNNTIAAGVRICGYTNIGSRNWIGPNATISHMIDIGSNNFISIGSIVLRNVQDNSKIVGSKIFTDRKLF